MDGLTVNVDHGVFHGWVIAPEVEVDATKGLFRVIPEQGVLDQPVDVLVGQAGGLPFVERIHALNSGINFVGIRAVPVGREDDDTGDLFPGDILKDLLAFLCIPVPGVF